LATSPVWWPYLHDGAKLNLDEESKDFLKIINSWNQEEAATKNILINYT
jgi:hypothetical protein